MAVIILHGELKKFGERFEVFAPTADKCLKCVFVQIEGLRQAIESGYFKFKFGSELVSGSTEGEAGYNLINSFHSEIDRYEELHIIPAIGGSGNAGGVFTIIAGVVAVAAAFWTGGASIAAWSAATWGLAAAGAMMVVSGVIAATTKLPTATKAKQEAGNKNTAFSSVENMMGNGQVIPVMYGRNLTGSMVVSQQIDTLAKSIS